MTKVFKSWLLLTILLPVWEVLSREAASPEVLKVINVKTGENAGRLNSKIRVTTSGFDSVGDKKIVLYVEGIPFKDITSEVVSDNDFLFELQPGKLNETFFSFKGVKYVPERPLRVSVGLEGHPEIRSNKKFYFRFFDRTLVWITIIVLLVIVFFSFNLLRKRQLLSDSSGKSSLALIIMFCWTATILFSLIYFWIATLTPPVISDTILALLGLTGATTIASSTIRKDSLGVALVSRSILTSGLSDRVLVHRFQNVAFNLIYLAFFLWTVITEFQFPTYDANTLLLLGISNGTYIGLKINEEK